MRDYQRELSFDFGLFAEAQKYYAEAGFQDIAVPWVLDKKYIEETIPSGVNFYETLGGVLTGSAEQSFIQMLDKGWWEPGSYQATCPCFRDEEHNLLHSPYFMKTELFVNDDVSVDRLMDVIDTALTFFNTLVPARVEDLGDGTFDIVGLNSGVELGSYGIRRRLDFSWIYGTGLALPRLQHVQNFEKSYNYKLGK